LPVIVFHLVKVNSQWKFLEEGLETLKRFHKNVAKFEEWLATAEEVVYRDYYGNSYQELLTYYTLVKVSSFHIRGATMY